MTEIKKVPVKVAAYILGKSEQFIRCGLRYGSLNFGSAVSSNPHKKNAYHISPRKFMEYTGYTADEIFNTAKKLGVEI